MQSEFCTFLQSLSTFITFQKCVRPTKTTILVCDTHRAFDLSKGKFILLFQSSSL